MKLKSGLLLAILIAGQVVPLGAQELIKNSRVSGVCYAGNKVNRIYIPPPKAVFKLRDAKKGGAITVNYTGFTVQGKAAIEFAVQIIGNMLPPDAKFTIDASWEKISSSGVLAQSTITGYAGGFAIDALSPLSYYPVALAEKIAGKSINEDSQGDISLQVNSSINWYLGTDGKTPVDRYDLVTVAVHEICHGLGFFDSFTMDGTVGYYGIGAFPFIYDTFVENSSGYKLTDTTRFRNNSNDLGTQLTSGQVYFNGPLLKKYSQSVNYSITRAKLFAPSTWDGGSSISHLDESAASTLAINSLMTPYIDKGEAIHDPGKYTFSILGDIGWINTRIIHQPSGDTEKHLTQLNLAAIIQSDTTYNRNKVGVVYSFNNFLSSDTLYLASPSSDNAFKTSVAISGYNTELQYYFFVQDAFNRLYRSPSVYKDTKLVTNDRYHVYIGTDTVHPVISHTPVAYFLQKVDSLIFDASVTDNIAVDSVYLEYKVNNGPSRFARMKHGTTNNFKALVNARALSLKGSDSIQYRIFAVDSAVVSNRSQLPKTGFFVADIEEISSVLSEYSTDFSNSSADFFNIGFEVTRPAGFSKFGLNTKHPYESPEDNNKTINYTSILRHPLKFNETGLLINFNEVVLVEPGSAGSVFGSSEFFDYVIVEGSANFGKTWFPLADGYDSRYNPSWESAYNSNLIGDNSVFTGNETMLQKHAFICRQSDNFTAGDTLLLRFRLFSDPFANGWGWVIEDLRAGPLVDAIPEISKHNPVIYPNPGTGIIRISTGDPSNYKPIPYKVFNSSGICIVNSKTSGTSETIVDISRYRAGMYIILLYLDDGVRSVKYSLTK